MNAAFVFDLDGTLTRHELLPIIAKAAGLEEEMRLLTDLTIKGMIPFDASFKLRFAMLRAIPVEIVQASIAHIDLDPHLIKFIAANKEQCFIVTGNLANWIKPLVDKFNCTVFSNSAVEENGCLTSLNPLMLKSEPIRSLRKQFDKVVVVGEGANDMPMFEVADISIAFGGIHEPFEGLLEISDYVVYESRALCRLLNTL